MQEKRIFGLFIPTSPFISNRKETSQNIYQMCGRDIASVFQGLCVVRGSLHPEMAD